MFSIYLFIGLAMAFSSVFATSDSASSPSRSLCDPLPLGHGSSVFPDTPEAFQAHAAFADAALSATTPVGYIKSYANLLTTYNEASQFVHYLNMDTYNVDQCADACNNDDKCNAFTIFFERQPVESPEPVLCPNPSSTTFIKCDLWSGTILPSIALNHGQMRENFHVVMAGSNAYVKDISGATPSVPAGYAIDKYAVGAAIEAPLDCNGEETYMGLAYWRDGHFDIERCVTACKQAQGASSQRCHFVNTYMQRRNNVPTVQHCAMFSRYWPVQYATNVGQRRGNDEIAISATDSYGIRDTSADFSACLPLDDSASFAPSLKGTYVNHTMPFNSSVYPEAKKATTFETRARRQVVTETPPPSSTDAVIAPETFSDWDPVLETTTYISSVFYTAIIAPETFSDWDPAVETTTYSTPIASASSSAFATAVIAPETFSDWDPVYETTTYVERQLVVPTGLPVFTDLPVFTNVPDLA